MRIWIEYAAYRLMGFLVPLLPRRGVVWLGRRLGALYYLLSRRTRRVGLENLRRIFPERTDRRRILRRSVQIHSVALLDALWSARVTPRNASRWLKVEPEAATAFRLDIEQGRGGVVATAHYGSWEMFNAAGGALGASGATVIARTVPNPLIERHIKRAREQTGNRIVTRKQAMGASLAALRRGELVCSVIDIAVLPSEGGVFVDFMGTPAMTSAALPLLALRCNAPLYFIACAPVEGGRSYALRLQRIEIRPDAPREREVERLALELNRALEREVRRCPENWLWGYKRWKWRPGELGQAHFPSYSLWHHPLW